MDQLSILRRATNAGKLLRVEEVLFDRNSPRFVVGMVFQFERQTLHVNAQAEDDSLTIAQGSLPDPERTVFPVMDRTPWALVCGQRCFAAWLMINQQGYIDGLRLQFRARSAATCVEVVVAASALHCCHFVAEF